MLKIAALVISVLILHGLLGKMAGLRSFFSKKIHAGVLRQLTGIWNRSELVQKFGGHDGAFYFPVTWGKILAARRPLRWIFGNMWLEMILVAALLYMAMGNDLGTGKLHFVIMGFGIFYFIVSSILTFRMSVRSKSQFDEEVAVLQKRRLERFGQGKD